MRSKKQRIVVILSLILLLLLIVIIFSVMDKPSDFVVYNEIIATMSMDKAKQFFDDFPNSPYKDILVNELMKWCEQEKTEETYKLILATYLRTTRDTMNCQLIIIKHLINACVTG